MLQTILKEPFGVCVIILAVLTKKMFKLWAVLCNRLYTVRVIALLKKIRICIIYVEVRTYVQTAAYSTYHVCILSNY